ncbi:Hypp3928 [Branchiostoma lanceolatum]|uniref:Hypp3928 protein n=1 Tax=Branchiostoma lanceolatum TaxID=7740 RepID=A0A8K0A5P9_BRALA|nr:Hypp3928 [Branchiostoma lanceolatum]
MCAFKNLNLKIRLPNLHVPSLPDSSTCLCGNACKICQSMSASCWIIRCDGKMAINPRSVRSIGLSLIVFGALSVIFGLASDLSFSDAYLHQASGPIWSGVFVLITGILAASIHYEKGNRCIMIALTTLATMSVLLTIASWIISSIGLNGRDTCPVSSCLSVKALHGVSLVLSAVETVLSVVCVILGCVGIWSPQGSHRVLHGVSLVLSVVCVILGCVGIWSPQGSHRVLHGVSLVLSAVETVLSVVCVILGCVGIWSPQGSHRVLHGVSLVLSVVCVILGCVGIWSPQGSHRVLHGVSLVLSVVCVILGCVGIWSPQDHSDRTPPYPQQQFSTPTQQPVVIVQASPGVPVSSPPPGVSPGVQYVYVPVSSGESLHPSPHAHIVPAQGVSPQQVIYAGQRLSPAGPQGQGASSPEGQGSASPGQSSGQGTTGRRRGKPAPPPPYEATEGDSRQPPINPEFSGRRERFLPSSFALITSYFQRGSLFGSTELPARAFGITSGFARKLGTGDPCAEYFVTIGTSAAIQRQYLCLPPVVGTDFRAL